VRYCSMSHTVFGLPISMASAWIFNCYVIDAGGDVTVVDPGLPIVAGRALEMITGELGYSAADIASVLCTHAHPDHVAGVSTVTEQASCGAHLPARCRAYLEGEEPRTFPLVGSLLKFMPVWGGQSFSARALTEFARYGKTVGFGGPSTLTLDFDPAGYLDDADPLPAAAGWQTIHAPGHTDDSTCFYHADSETLISGDAVVTLDGRPWFNPEHVDAGLATETEERLRSLKVRHLLPGHGTPVQGTDVWRHARSFSTPPEGSGILARCSRRFAKW